MGEDDVIKTRFAEEVGALGLSKMAIASKIGFSSQTFTNVTSGRNLPGAALLSRIARVFPSFDASYVLTGIRRGDESEILKKLREELEFKDSLLRITTRAAKGEAMGKNKGATLSPRSNKVRREESAKKTIWNIRNKPATISLPGSVPQPFYTVL